MNGHHFGPEIRFQKPIEAFRLLKSCTEVIDETNCLLDFRTPNVYHSND